MPYRSHDDQPCSIADVADLLTNVRISMNSVTFPFGYGTYEDQMDHSRRKHEFSRELQR